MRCFLIVTLCVLMTFITGCTVTVDKRVTANVFASPSQFDVPDALAATQPTEDGEATLNGYPVGIQIHYDTQSENPVDLQQDISPETDVSAIPGG